MNKFSKIEIRNEGGGRHILPHPGNRELFVPLTDVRAVSEEAEGVFEGYGSVFDTEDSYGDTVKKGAFKKSIKSQKMVNLIKMLWSHDVYAPIGKWLELREDDKGLYCKGRLLINIVEKAKEVWGLMKEGVIDGLSIGFYADPNKQRDLGNWKRELLDIELLEISPVLFPACRPARIENVRSFGNVRQEEQALRELGLSQKDAKYYASCAEMARRGEAQRDADLQRLMAEIQRAKQAFSN